ncbi:MAG: 50S ribosomal protein L11 methyltransferase [Christensenellaceae bacterium]|nr:50S ribosomal protein L11 methyltransferase [Christensenellaceae bacterium]
MNWKTINIYLTHEEMEIFTAELMEIGIYNFAAQDPEEFGEFLNNTFYYDYIEDDVMEILKKPCTLTVYLPEDDQGTQMLADLKNLIGEHGYTSDIGDIKEEDWADNWKKYFKPIKLGRNLYIKPSWETIEDTEGRVVLEIDPSSSFGSGTHETTQLCLEALTYLVHGDEEILDMGCGSGILGIGGLLLGAKSVKAVDIEENSMRVTHENAEMNHVTEKIEAICGNVLDDEDFYNKITSESFDIITANIVADVIIAMMPLFKKCLRKNGRLVVSGIIDDRQNDVIDALVKHGFSIRMTAARKDWRAITACLKA